jgi:hypothetical protein
MRRRNRLDFEVLPDVGPGSIIVFHDTDDDDGILAKAVIDRYKDMAFADGKSVDTPLSQIAPMIVFLHGTSRLVVLTEDEMRAAGRVRA